MNKDKILKNNNAFDIDLQRFDLSDFNVDAEDGKTIVEDEFDKSMDSSEENNFFEEEQKELENKLDDDLENLSKEFNLDDLNNLEEDFNALTDEDDKKEEEKKEKEKKEDEPDKEKIFKFGDNEYTKQQIEDLIQKKIKDAKSPKSGEELSKDIKELQEIKKSFKGDEDTQRLVDSIERLQANQEKQAEIIKKYEGTMKDTEARRKIEDDISAAEKVLGIQLPKLGSDEARKIIQAGMSKNRFLTGALILGYASKKQEGKPKEGVPIPQTTKKIRPTDNISPEKAKIIKMIIRTAQDAGRSKEDIARILKRERAAGNI